jgi:hypothetical protein
MLLMGSLGFRAVFTATIFASVPFLGCTVQTSAPAPVGTAARPPAPIDGTLALDWTLNGVTDPNQCNQAVSVSLLIDISDSAGVYTSQAAPCNAFATNISLPPTRYTAKAKLVDGAGNPRTTTIDVNPFTIVEGTTFRVPIEFPASSFY